MVWSRDSRVVYALAYPINDARPGELYRIDPAQRKAELVTGSTGLDTRLHTISRDGRWLLTQTEQNAVAVDLTTGRVQSYSLPAKAVIAHWQ